MKVKVEVADQMIEDQIVCALEGGSNYWYYLPDLSMIKGIKSGEPLAIRLTDAVLNHGIVVPVYDIDDEDELLGELSRDSIQKALDIMSKDYPDAFAEVLNESGDANTADIFFQLSVMGEIVFG